MKKTNTNIPILLMECSKAQMTYLGLCNESEIEIATMSFQQYSFNEKQNHHLESIKIGML